MRRRRLLSIGVVVSLILSITSIYASASSPATQAMQLVNRERTSRGRAALTWNSEAGRVARAHSADMASSGELRHNMRLAEQMHGWSRLGENVGTGDDIDIIHHAFMGSASHRANVLDSHYTQIGIGVVTDADGVLWITQIFYTPEARRARRVSRSPAPRPAVRATPAAQRVAQQARSPRPATPLVRKAVVTTSALATRMRPLGTVTPFGR